jgi:chromosomal replication initiation ATPase DnaA
MNSHEGLTEAVIGLATEHDPAQLEVMLDSLSNVQLRSLSAALATRIAHNQTTSLPPAQNISSPEHMCNVAIEAAAKTFGTTAEAILSSARAQEICDARAVAMTAARANGLSLAKIAEHFDKDHGSVIHAVRRTTDRPRLAAAASSIAEDITSRYQQITEERPALRLVGSEPESAAGAPKPAAQDVTVVGAAIEAAAWTFETDPQLLRGPDRTRPVADARAVAMTAARINGLSLPKIAAEFGDRHHTVVLQATRRIEKTAPLRELAERIAKDIPKAENPSTAASPHRATPAQRTTRTPARGQQADRAAAALAPASQPALAPRR